MEEKVEKDRRIYDRFGFCAPVRFSSPEEDVTGRGFSEDISGGGIRLRSKSKISPKSVLNLEIDIPETDVSLSLSAKVIWTKQVSEGQYIAGLAFKDVDLMGLWLVFKKIYHKWIKEDRIPTIF